MALSKIPYLLCSHLSMSTKSDFTAAEEIKAILTGRDPVEQERIIRWVNESLGLAKSPTAPITSPVQALPSPQSSASSSIQPSVQGPSLVKKDIRSFVAEKMPKSDVQFAVVAAYFYRFTAPETERKETITPKELDNAGRQARGYAFKKSLQTLYNARNLGYFDSAGRGEFKLNAVGENLVAMALPGTTSKSTVIKSARGRTKRPGLRGAIPRKPNSSAESKKKSKISATGRAKIAAAQKARWAKLRRGKAAS